MCYMSNGDLFSLQYKFSESEVRARTLWLSVWDWDRFGRNLFLGEVRLPLANLDLTSTADQWYQLQDKVMARNDNDSLLC